MMLAILDYLRSSERVGMCRFERLSDRRRSSIACLLAVPFGLTISVCEAQTRPYTPELVCAEVKAIVAQSRHVVLATSPNAYELVHVDGGSCGEGLTSVPAFEPTRDEPNCFAGYRCKDRSNDATGTR